MWRLKKGLAESFFFPSPRNEHNNHLRGKDIYLLGGKQREPRKRHRWEKKPSSENAIECREGRPAFLPGNSHRKKGVVPVPGIQEKFGETG